LFVENPLGIGWKNFSQVWVDSSCTRILGVDHLNQDTGGTILSVFAQLGVFFTIVYVFLSALTIKKFRNELKNRPLGLVWQMSVVFLLVSIGRGGDFFDLGFPLFFPFLLYALVSGGRIKWAL
jgi:uncharacterized membrane protein YoaK (UPF0700 family)